MVTIVGIIFIAANTFIAYALCKVSSVADEDMKEEKDIWD